MRRTFPLNSLSRDHRYSFLSLYIQPQSKISSNSRCRIIGNEYSSTRCIPLQANFCRTTFARWNAFSTAPSTISIEQRGSSRNKTNHSTKTSRIPTNKRPEIVLEIKKILSKKVGSFRYPDDYDRARRLIEDTYHKTQSGEASNACIHLWERTVQEYSHFIALRPNSDSRCDADSNNQKLWFCDPHGLNGILTHWNDASALSYSVIPPRSLVQKLQWMSTLLPSHFRYNISSMNIIMQVIVRQEAKHTAPIVAEQLLDLILSESKIKSRQNDISLKPNSYTYATILKAWAESGLPEAFVRVEKLIRVVHDEFKKPDVSEDEISVVPYKIILRFFSDQLNCKKVEDVLNMVDSVVLLKPKIDGEFLSDVVYAFAKSGLIARAESMFDRILAMNESNKNPLHLSANYLLAHYRDHIATITKQNRYHDANINNIVNENIECAEKVFEKVSREVESKSESLGHLQNTIMNIYACARRLDLVEMAFNQIAHPTVSGFNILVKAYGMCNEPERAGEVVQKMLNDPNLPNPTIDTLNTLIGAWANANGSYSNTANRAYSVFECICNDEKCVELKLRPNNITYSSLLKCLATSQSSITDDEIVSKVEAILQEVENRYLTGDKSCIPDSPLYSVAIKALLAANDLHRAEAILNRMEKSNLSPTINIRPSKRTYSEFLNYYAKLGTVEAAEHAEEVLNRLRSLSKTTDPSLKPNNVTYNIVFHAWQSTGDASAPDRIWQLYEQMTNYDNLHLDRIGFTVAINCLSKSKKSADMSKAMQILRCMHSKRKDCINSRSYTTIFNSAMRKGDVENAAQAMQLLFDAILNDRCKVNEIPSRSNFDWIIHRWILSNKLKPATLFLENLLPTSSYTAIQRHRYSTHLFGMGPGLDSILDLRKAWAVSLHPDKDTYLKKMDELIIPSFVHQ